MNKQAEKKKKRTLTQKFHVLLSASDHKRLLSRAAKDHRNASEIIRLAISRFLEGADKDTDAIPLNIKKLFWDAGTIDLKEHASHVIERVLEFGDDEACKWLFLTFDRDAIIDVIENNKALSRKSRAFWKAWHGIEDDENTQEMPSSCWMDCSR